MMTDLILSRISYKVAANQSKVCRRQAAELIPEARTVGNEWILRLGYQKDLQLGKKKFVALNMSAGTNSNQCVWMVLLQLPN